MSINLKSNIELKQIRQQVLSNTQVLQNLIPPTVSYTTEGNLLIVGPEDLARFAAGCLTDGSVTTMGQIAILVTEAITSQDEAHLEQLMLGSESIESFYNRLIEIKGFLGQFQVKVENDASSQSATVDLSMVAIRKTHFDIILDLNQTPCIALEMLPVGYFYVGHDQVKLDEAIEQLPDFIGEFEKPRYVKVNADICAHHRNGLDGCNRCLNFCPADAIQSIDKLIEIDPYLCHGAGSCTNACPTGAISYDLPTPQALHSHLHKLVTRYRAAAQVAPVILFHDEANGAALVVDELPGDIISVALEEVTVASMEHWLSALAWGARQIMVLYTKATAATLVDMLKSEHRLACDIFDEIGQPHRITLINEDNIMELEPLLSLSGQWPIIIPSEPIVSSKRDALFTAIDHLNEQAAQVNTQLNLSNIPFGRVSINSDKCTLCLSCVSTCPTQALTDGGERPAVNFIEQACVQCGLCEAACPENVITLTAQINFDKAQRQQSQTLTEEEPFECIRCGAPFATLSMVQRMQEVVGGHSAFSDNAQRLQMCSDCRVKDMFEDILQDPEKQLQ